MYLPNIECFLVCFRLTALGDALSRRRTRAVPGSFSAFPLDGTHTPVARHSSGIDFGQFGNPELTTYFERRKTEQKKQQYGTEHASRHRLPGPSLVDQPAPEISLTKCGARWGGGLLARSHSPHASVSVCMCVPVCLSVCPSICLHLFVLELPVC